MEEVARYNNMYPADIFARIQDQMMWNMKAWQFTNLVFTELWSTSKASCRAQVLAWNQPKMTNDPES